MSADSRPTLWMRKDLWLARTREQKAKDLARYNVKLVEKKE